MVKAWSHGKPSRFTTHLIMNTDNGAEKHKKKGVVLW
jgi:hypothetical protein